MIDTTVGPTWIRHYSGDANPAVLFDGVKFRLDIVISRKEANPRLFSGPYAKWFHDERPALFSLMSFTQVGESVRHLSLLPKLAGPLALSVLLKLLRRAPLRESLGQQGKTIYVHRVMTMFIKCFDFVPYFRNELDGVKKSDDYKPYRFGSDEDASVALAVLNSSTFLHYFVAYGDCFHCGKEFVETFPVGLSSMSSRCRKDLIHLGQELMVDMKRHAVRKRASSEKTGSVEYDEFWPRYSKPITDRIDRVLAEHYGFTAEELDFIVNYDVKYRMGRDGGGEGE